MKSICFFALRPLHLPILEPLAKEIISLGFEVSFCLYPQNHTSSDVGFNQDQIQQFQTLQYLTVPYDELLMFDATICADFVYEYIEQWGKIICVGHGTLSKNIYFTSEKNAWRENWHHLLCVPGPAYLKNFEDKLLTRSTATGFIPFDYIKTPSVSTEVQSLQKIILFAPTYSDDLHCMREFFEALPHLNQYQIWIKLHGATAPEWVQIWQKATQLFPNLTLIHTPILQVIQNCHIVISDWSSVLLESLLSDKPIIAWNTSSQKKSPFYHLKNIETKYRSIFYNVDDQVSFLNTLQLLQNQDPLFLKRCKAKAELFPSLHTSSTQQTALKIIQEINQNFERNWECSKSTLIYCPNNELLPAARLMLSLSHHAEICTSFEDYSSSDLQNRVIIKASNSSFPYEWDSLIWLNHSLQNWDGFFTPLTPHSPDFLENYRAIPFAWLQKVLKAHHFHLLRTELQSLLPAYWGFVSRSESNCDQFLLLSKKNFQSNHIQLNHLNGLFIF